MRLIRSPAQMTRLAGRLRRQGRSIGFVPTMGALHEGHLSLVRAARRATDAVVVSIFVNPLQFGPLEDFRTYPRHLRQDLRLLRQAGVAVAFVPNRRAMYPAGFQTRVEVKRLSAVLEGASRPGHFRGVATVVAKLFNLVQPTVAYFGQKDYQQALVIQRMVRDLDWPIRIRVLPIIREPGGLAMSSRNAYLSPEERRQAAVLPQALRDARRRILDGERRAAVVAAAMRRQIERAPLVRVDRIDLVDAGTLSPRPRLQGRVALLGAVRVGRTRLIDNVLVDVP
jgi:pantoate--beta-alanine ligase